MRKIHNTLPFLFLLIIISLNYSEAEVNLGISGNNQQITVDKFPFSFSSHFTVFNTGEKDAVYTISTLGEYADVVSWIELEKNLISLKRGEYREIWYNANAIEGYGGNYAMKIIVMGYEDSKGSKDLEKNSISYLMTSGSINLDITVPEKLGESSLGPEHPKTNGNQGEEFSFFQEVVNDIDMHDTGMVLHQTDKPIFIDAPETIETGKNVTIGASYIGETVSDDLGIMLISPSERIYEISSNATFNFDEAGTWGMIITSKGTAVIGRSIEVVEKGISLNNGIIFASVGIVILLAGLFILRHARSTKKVINIQ